MEGLTQKLDKWVNGRSDRILLIFYQFYINIEF